jgi:hypothetical protein
MPSVAASLIERLPEDGNPQRPAEEIYAQNVLFAAYVGTWVMYMSYLNLGNLTDFFYCPSPVLGGADTVSKKNDNIVYDNH